MKVPRGNEIVIEFPGIAIPAIDAIDGKRTAEECVSKAINTFLNDLNTTREQLPPDEQADLEELTKSARLSLILAAQSGLITFELPK